MITKLELRRQIVHVSLGLIITSLLFYDLITYHYLLLASIITLAISSMMKKKLKIPIITKFFLWLQRDSEKKGMPLKGGFFYLLGSTIAVLIFPKETAIASILILAFGDSISRLVGPYGYIKHPFNNKKFLEGIFIGGFVATLVAWQFVPLLYALVASFSAMIIEGFDIEIDNHKVDDNLTIPIISGLVIQILSILII